MRRPSAAGVLVTVSIATVAGLAVMAIPAAAKSFVFARVAIEATVAPDGSLRIVEARTYRFDGSFSWASYRLPLVGASRIRQIGVADERGPYAPGNLVGPGVYRVRREGNQVEIVWGFQASNESRTFTISYVLDDVVTVYADVAELYWKFIGTGWDHPSEDVRVEVKLPGSLAASEIRAWGHGPLHGTVRPVSGGAMLAVRHLPASTMVEGRIVFPHRVVPQARRRTAETALPRILKEEAAWAAQANRRRQVARVAQGGMVALPAAVVALWFAMYLRYGREPNPSVPEGYYRELPGRYTPAELGVLWRFGSVQPADFVATVLDLARRGYLRVETAVGEGFLGLGRDEQYTLVRTDKVGGLAAFESDALALLFGSPDAPGSVTVSRRRGLPDEVKRRVGRRFSSWSGAVRRAADREKFFDGTSMRISSMSLVAGFVVLFAGLWASIAAQALAGIAATAVAGLVLILGHGALRRRSQQGADDLRRWQGFRRFLLDFSEMPRAELPSLALWEHYLVYAVPLGVADRVIQQLGRIYPAEELARSPGLSAWTASSGSGRGGPLASLSGFTTALAAATSSASSASGGGGGFSGGGGGGGGGSGGSAG
ncbi:MAG: DUF2207 domain-containing protein [Armatimonadota bacterium]|nr:DUF2207 domain-containing protein [Armatimonadota bacterium]